MTEQLLQFIWQFQYFNKASLFTTDGQRLNILSSGQINTNQGADFDQARVMIGPTTWAGRVELHIFTSDWIKHKHQDDPNYQKVILHVVWVHNREVRDHLGNQMPTFELQPLVSKTMLQQYEKWMNTEQQIPCGSAIAEVPDLIWQSWLQRLTAERLLKKHELIQHHLKKTNNHWDEVFWRLLCKYFGGNVNSTSFGQIAESLPITLLAKHQNQIHQLEALLLGQSGLLHSKFGEQYPQMLYREYQFLQKKYGLRVINLPPSFLRMRPGNFPTVRLAQLAMLLHKNWHFFDLIKTAPHPDDFADMIKVTANDYWHYHYRFDDLTEFQPKQVGTQMFDNILINALVPLMFSYGIYTDEEAPKEKAIRWLEHTPAEKNGKIALLQKAGIAPANAFESQALLQLKTEWCDAKRCLRCAVGNHVLRHA